MPFKTIVDPKTGQSRDEFIEPAAGAAPAAKPAAAAKPEGGGLDIGAMAAQAAKGVVEGLGLVGGPAIGQGLGATQVGISTMAKTGDVGQSLAAAGKALNEPGLVQRMGVNALRNIAQEPVNVVADLTGRPTTAANPDAPFPGLGRPLPKLAPKLGPLEETATGLLQIGLEFIPVARAVSWGGKALKAIPGVARGVQVVEAARETGLVGLAATGQVGKVATLVGLRVATRAFSPTNVATGAIIDYAGVNPHGGRIYDLVDNVQQQITGTPMEFPVLNYFKSRPGDVGSKARLKNALEGGLILGPVQDVLMSLFRAAKYVSRLRGVAPDGAEAAAGQAKQAAQEFEQKAAEFVNSGRPPEPAQAPAAAPAPAQTAPPDAAAAAAATVAQERYSRAQAKLSTHGPAPAKPSSEKKTFGTRGIANADPAAVARWQLETKAYQSWNRKYAPLKKEEVAAANELAAAQQKLGTTEPQVTPGVEAAPVLARPADPASGFAIPPEPIGPAAPSVPSAGTSASATAPAPAIDPAAIAGLRDTTGLSPEEAAIFNEAADLLEAMDASTTKGLQAARDVLDKVAASEREFMPEGAAPSAREAAIERLNRSLEAPAAERPTTELTSEAVRRSLPDKLPDALRADPDLIEATKKLMVDTVRRIAGDGIAITFEDGIVLKQGSKAHGTEGKIVRTGGGYRYEGIGDPIEETMSFHEMGLLAKKGQSAVDYTKDKLEVAAHEAFHAAQLRHMSAAKLRVLNTAFAKLKLYFAARNRQARAGGAKPRPIETTAQAYESFDQAAQAGVSPGAVILGMSPDDVKFFTNVDPKDPLLKSMGASDRAILSGAKTILAGVKLVDDLFDRMEKLYNAMRGRGWTSIRSIFEEAASGRLKETPGMAHAKSLAMDDPKEWAQRVKMLDRLGAPGFRSEIEFAKGEGLLSERATLANEQPVEPQGPELVRATMPDDPWVNKVVEQVQANRDALERNDITLDDILENNVQRIQSPSGRTQYVVDNPDMAMGYKAFSDLLSRVEATGIQTASFEQINVDAEVWLNSVNHNGKDVLTALERISGPLSNYRENLRALRAGQLLTDHANLQAGVAAAQWLNSALGGAIDRNQLGAQLFAAAAAQKQVNVAFEKVTRPVGQLLWSLQNPRPEPGSVPFNMGEEGAAAAGATPGEAPLPSTKDIKTELETALQEGQGAPVSESLGGTLSPETVEAINTGDFSNPKVQAEMDALAMVLSSGSIDPGFSRNFWTNLPGNVALGARGLNMMHASFLVSSGETINTNLLNGLVRLIDLPLTQAAGALTRGDLASAGTALQMFVGYARSVVGASRLAAHSFRLGRGFYDISHQSVDMMERLATQEATNSLAGVPTEAERVWTINDTPLIDATDKSNGAHALRAVWRTMTGPLRGLTTGDTFIKALAGDSFEFTQNLRPGLERAIELGMEPGSKEAWKWANQYAEQVVKAKKRDLIVEGKTITDAIMTSPNALNAARYATFTDDVWAEMEWNMPNPATGKPIGRSFERGAQLAAAKNITDPKEVTKFVENYLKNGTLGEAASEAMMSTVGRTLSAVPAAYTLLSQDSRVGPVFQALQPFIRTPFDIIKSLARKTPAAVLTDTWWRDLNSSNQAIRDKAVGDVALGTTALALTGLAIATGNVRFNGAGPLNEEAKRKWMSGGRMPYSFQRRVGTDPGGMPRWGKAHSLRIFEPYTSIFAGMSDYLDLSGNLSTEQLNNVGANMVGDLLARVAVGQLSKQYFQGLYDIVDVVMSVGDVESGPNVRNPLNKYLSRLAAGYTIPSAFSSGRRILDQTARSVPASGLASEYLDEAKSRIAGWSKSIPPIVDWITGEDVVLAGIYGQQHLPADQPWLGLLYQFVPWSPLKVASPPHRVLQEMGALHGKGANFNGPSANDFGVELRLDVKTFNAYKREVATVVRDEAGRTLVEALQQEIDGPQYQALPFAERGTVAPAERVAQLSLIINKFKAMGKQTFLNRPENATLLRQYNERQAKISAVGQGGVEPAQTGGSWSPTPGNR